MKFISLTTLLSSLFVPALCVTVTYDTTYDSSTTSLNTVACSNGANGLVNKYPTFGDLPDFPYIGGAPAIAGWNSPNCGTCWALTYTPSSGNSKTINVLAIDVASKGFNIALEAMNDLTDGQAVELGVVSVTASEVDKSVCGI